jgi:nicotinate-nucleotide adenylyltransferase
MVSKLITKQTANIGILGGTFDPIHLGHTLSAQAVAQELKLTKILFIPAHIPPHKNDVNSAPTVSAEKRAMMVELACEENALFECDKRELERQQHSYTVDTLITLKQEFPEQSLCFIIGMDSLLTFTRWHRYQDILSLCHLVVNSRPNFDLTQINDDTKALLNKHQVRSLDELNKSHTGAIFFTKPMAIDISSTEIRDSLQNNKSCHAQLYASVKDFINKNQLYR